jgi:hypothetical protein
MVGHTLFRNATRPRRTVRLRSAVAVAVLASCDPTTRSGDTLGLQSLGRWEWHGHLVTQADPTLTLTRMQIDPTPGGGDVMLLRYDFNPGAGAGAEFALALGVELGKVKGLGVGQAYPIGPPPAPLPAFATATCLCRPLRPDSVRGTLSIATRGVRHLSGRIDATLYFTEWNDSTRHATYPLHQRFDAVK